MNSTHIVKASEIKRAWYLVDAEGLALGRVASEVARILKEVKVERL
jgi:large subunit ribosomal protein L13